MQSLPIISTPHQSGTSVTTDEPMLLHHYQLQSIVYIRVHSWCYIFYGFRRMLSEYISTVTVSHRRKNPLCSTYSSLPVPRLFTFKSRFESTNFCQLYIPSTYKTFTAHSRCSLCTDKSSGSFNAPATELEVKKEKKMLKMNRTV